VLGEDMCNLHVGGNCGKCIFQSDQNNLSSHTFPYNVTLIQLSHEERDSMFHPLEVGSTCDYGRNVMLCDFQSQVIKELTFGSLEILAFEASL
jgi:hypothetical protein